MMSSIWNATIWAQTSPVDEFRNFKRVWMPLWLIIAMASGFNAINYGSRIIDRLYGPWTDLAGAAYMLVAGLALAATIFPRLWGLALATAFLLLGMNAVYITGVAIAPSPEQLAAKEAPNWFIVTQLIGLIVILFVWIDRLINEWVDRRAEARRLAASVEADE